MIDIPLSLKNALETQNCVLFIGAGVGLHYKKPDGSTAPNGKELCKLLADKFSISLEDNSSLSQISELVEIRKGRKELETFISSQLSDLVPDEIFQWIPSVRWKAIYTTNYDNCIERAYQLCAKPIQNPVSFSITSNFRPFNIGIDVPIYHIHGHFLSGDSPNIIVTKTDYAKFRKRRKMLFEALKLDMATASVLYIGYSNADPNWEILLEETVEEFLPTILPQSFRIDPFTNIIDSEILESKNIHTFNCSFEEFVNTVTANNICTNPPEDVIDKFKKSVPRDLITAFEKSPIPLKRLLSSWEYVNQAEFNAQPNLLNFLKGDTANWSLISNEQYFERDIQGDLYDAILEFATTTKSYPTTSIIVGSAGYGTTTLLRILSVQIVKEGAGAVFFLKPGAHVLEGDIEYAVSLFTNVFFIVDDAAIQISELKRCLHMLRETKKRAMAILGSRINEWHQRSSRPSGQEYLLNPLSDNEIKRLLDFLSKNNSLNKLESLPYDIQFNTIKENLKKELLVVMREATEDNNFDAIIESEYRGIADEFSKLFYLYVCCFYQHGAYIRDTLIADLLDIELPELYKKTTDTTEGVVIFDCMDTDRGFYAARARHHKIAAVVWERCGAAANRDEIIQKAINVLNLNYGIDAKAFELFIKSDRIVDCIRSFEGRVTFFERASQIDPTSPYVRQHYARMLSRSGQHKLALTQIENAIKNDPNVKVLYHSKGKILSELALNEKSIAIGRKYLIQAESCFLKGIALNTRDSYGFESLASLYFYWAKKVDEFDHNEAIDYLSKTEETISNGLRTVRNREALWILSSKVHTHLGNQPVSFASLETAVQERPGSIVARYVLGRTYRSNGQVKEAINILEPIIKSNTDEFRAFIEYALALLDNNEPYKTASSIL
jgi:tetratricopeptide (TPR) repeat protein